MNVTRNLELEENILLLLKRQTHQLMKEIKYSYILIIWLHEQKLCIHNHLAFIVNVIILICNNN